jgi:hypothetical protein
MFQHLPSNRYFNSKVEDAVSAVAKYPLYKQLGKGCSVNSCEVSFITAAGVEDVVTSVAKYPLYQLQGKRCCVNSCNLSLYQQLGRRICFHQFQSTCILCISCWVKYVVSTVAK